MVEITVTETQTIELEIKNASAVGVEVKPEPVVQINLEGELIKISEHDEYRGPYTFTPTFENQKIPTKELLMGDDVTVSAIPVVTVSNAAGGNTVIIGG
ncbi:MAG: hypothetical protein IKY78_10605 [Clostridia bacterium]|nr:hypothetical protein [Clostridia bacterium]